MQTLGLSFNQAVRRRLDSRPRAFHCALRRADSCDRARASIRTAPTDIVYTLSWRSCLHATETGSDCASTTASHKASTLRSCGSNEVIDAVRSFCDFLRLEASRLIPRSTARGDAFGGLGSASALWISAHSAAARDSWTAAIAWVVMDTAVSSGGTCGERVAVSSRF